MEVLFGQGESTGEESFNLVDFIFYWQTNEISDSVLWLSIF